MARGRSSATSVALLGATCALVGCYDVHTVDPGHRVVPVVTESSGWVAPEGNGLGVTGFWYSYGDQYDHARRCTEIGKHTPDECSHVAWPTPLPALDFPNVDNSLCTYGDAALVICPAGVEDCTSQNADYSNIWGAGIGLDFGLEVDGANLHRMRDPSTRTTWNADEHGVIGVAFDFNWTDPSATEEPFVRVEFPIKLTTDTVLPADTVTLDGMLLKQGETLPAGSSSEEHSSGSPFLDAPDCWGSRGDPSSVVIGHNERLFSEAKGPPLPDCDSHPVPAYPFDPTNLLGIAFHVPTVTSRHTPYGFCVTNLSFLMR